MATVISDCGKYRYRLEREVDAIGGGPVYAFFGVNPSTADATLDDATVRKWTGFVKRWGGSRFIVGNVFAYRATDVRELATLPGPVLGDPNWDHLRAICAEADILVPCWGNRTKVPKSLWYAFGAPVQLCRASGKPVRTFGLTASGDPKHPLMLGYDTPLIDF